MLENTNTGFFAEEDDKEEANNETQNSNLIKKILVVDDEPDIHTVTKMTLEDFSFDGKHIEIISAYSAEEAKSILKKQSDISLVLLDVVMESDTAGLSLVNFIRKDLKNKNIRIILRTGQPGIVPERKVMDDYDIDDYREKTELTADKLYSVVKTGLRTFTFMKQLESKLRESEEKYRAMYEETPLSYQSLDINGNFLDINPKWLSTLGYTKEEVVGKWFGDFLHPDYVEHFRKNFPEFKKRGYVNDVQFFMRKKDGEYIYISFEGCIGYTPSGEFKQTYCVFKDVTKEFEIEKQLKESEEKFREVFEYSSLGKSITRIDGSLKINKAFSEILGYTLDELKSKKWEDITHPDDIQESMNVVQSLVDGKATKAKYEKRYINKKGSIVWVEVNTVLKRDSDNVPQYFFTTIQDITERKQVLEQLKKSEERYRLLFNLLPYGGEVLDKKGIITNCSSSTAQMLGYEVSEIEGTPIGKFLTPDSLSIFKREFSNLANGKAANAEIQMICKDGSILNILRAAQPILDEHGKVESILALNLDITERKQAEEELDDSLKREQEQADIVRNAPIAIAYGFPDGSLANCNQAFCDLTGYSEEELKSINWNTILTPQKWNTIESEELKKLNSENNSIRYVKEYIHKNGKIIPIELVVTMKFDTNNNVLHFIGFITDITERKQAEQELNKHQEHLEELIKERTLEVEQKNKKLSDQMKIFVGRELKIRDLEKKINALQSK